jgi:hypothetical protein
MTGESGEPVATISLSVELSIESEVGIGQNMNERVLGYLLRNEVLADPLLVIW